MSSLLDLIEAFSSREIVPVEVDHIVDYLKSCGIKDNIFFFDAKMDAEILKGSILHWEYQSQGWTHRVADIYVAQSLSIEDKRLVQAKEVLHILDPRIDRVSTLEDVQALIEQMALPVASIDPQTASDHAKSDRSALLHALPVLFPMAAREIFLSMMKAGKIDIEGIAKAVALPKTITAFIMSDIWVNIYETMMSALRAHVPVPDKIFTQDKAGKTLEIYSVPLEDDPYVYAKRLEERIRGTAMEFHIAIVETRRERREFTASQLIAYTPWSVMKLPGRRI